MDLRHHMFVLGALVNATAGAMLIPFCFDMAMGAGQWWVFLQSAAIVGFIGTLLMIASRERIPSLNLRQALLLTVLIWVTMGAVGTVPFLVAPLDLSLAGAFFESMSGITTTGSTVLTGLDQIQPGVLLWRAMLQWLGGVGIVVMALSVLPALQVGGMQLFRTEAFEQSEKMLPRAGEIATAVLGVYGLITAGGFLMLLVAGMGPFDALTHAMTAIATGGYSTHDASIGYFQSASIDLAVIVLMILGSLPFVAFFRLRSLDFQSLIYDSQIRLFFFVLLGAIALMVTALLTREILPLGAAIQQASFNVVSIMTGTGFSTSNYESWGIFATLIVFLIMFIGGCAGSTTCGIKVFRFQVLFGHALVQLRTMLQPSGVFKLTFHGKTVSEAAVSSVTTFFVLFTSTTLVLALFLGLCEPRFDLSGALVSAATSVANVGPALGGLILQDGTASSVGPAGTFAQVNDTAKALMSVGMLLGRLELLTVMALFLPALWRD